MSGCVCQHHGLAGVDSSFSLRTLQMFYISWSTEACGFSTSMQGSGIVMTIHTYPLMIKATTYDEVHQNNTTVCI